MQKLILYFLNSETWFLTYYIKKLIPIKKHLIVCKQCIYKLDLYEEFSYGSCLLWAEFVIGRDV